MIAALFVARGGCYFGLPNVDPWDESRDARLYAGPWPVVAHPPCARWGRFAVRAFGKIIGRLGDDGGCFAAALAAVRRFGGVLEHPASSHAWRMHGLLDAPMGGGWHPAGDLQGWTCTVEQGHFGHRLRKASWLYAVCPRALLPVLPMWPSRPDGFRTGPTGGGGFGSTYATLSTRARAATPIPFRDRLIAIAESSLAARKGAA